MGNTASEMEVAVGEHRRQSGGSEEAPRMPTRDPKFFPSHRSVTSPVASERPPQLGSKRKTRIRATFVDFGDEQPSRGRQSVAAFARRSGLKPLVSSARQCIQEVIDGGNLTSEQLSKLKDAVRMLKQADTGISGSFCMPSPAMHNAMLNTLVAQSPTASVGLDAVRGNDEVRRYLVGTCTEEGTNGANLGKLEVEGMRGSLRFPHALPKVREAEIEDLVTYSPEVTALLDKVGQFDVDTGAIARAGEVEGKAITHLFRDCLSKTGLLLNMPDGVCTAPHSDFQDRLLRFMNQVDEKYESVIYHNNVHAADVMMMMHWFFTARALTSYMNHIDHLMSLVAAAIHDMGHDGFNNLYHIKTCSSLALRYNDRSPLENMHVANAFDAMAQNPLADWFGQLSRKFQLDASQKPVDLKAYMRKGLVSMVLNTDNAKHDHLMGKLADLVEAIRPSDLEDSDSSAEEDDLGTESGGGLHWDLNDHPDLGDRKLDFLEVLLHASDTSNAARPRPIMLYFTKRVLMEFWRQGDEERRLGLDISPLCDRATGAASVPKGQIGFSKFVVMPLFKHIAAIVDEATEATEGLEANLKFWTQQSEAKATFEEIYRETLE